MSLASLFRRRPAPVPAPRSAATPVAHKPGSRLKRNSALAAACITLTGGFEACREVAYRDPVGIPTVCMGETRGVRMGDRYTRAECETMLATRLDEFAQGMEACVPTSLTMPVDRYAAHLSLSYNIGTGAYCRSSVARLENAGQTRASCDAFLAWNKAGGVPLPGLTRRRREERDLCLKGLVP